VTAGAGIAPDLAVVIVLARFVGTYVTEVRMPGVLPILDAAAVLADPMPALRSELSGGSLLDVKLTSAGVIVAAERGQRRPHDAGA
jgi:hypothetical protein